MRRFFTVSSYYFSWRRRRRRRSFKNSGPPGRRRRSRNAVRFSRFVLARINRQSIVRKYEMRPATGFKSFRPSFAMDAVSADVRRFVFRSDYVQYPSAI